jgi:hypothetical protein
MNRRMETLCQTAPHVALEGDQSGFAGLARSAAHRWFTMPGARDLYRADTRERHGQVLVSQLRTVRAVDPLVNPVVEDLLARSAEFARLWGEHQIGIGYESSKHFCHPLVGELELHCQMLLSPEDQQALLVYTAEPGSVSDQRLSALTARR